MMNQSYRNSPKNLNNLNNPKLMSPEKWIAILGNIKDNFKVEAENNYHLDDEGGIDVEEIIFIGPLGRMKLELITKPVVIDKKVNYSNRIGSDSNVIYIYSKEERTNKLKAYKWDDAQGDWVELEAKNFNL